MTFVDKQKLPVETFANAQAVRQIAYALSLYVSGRYEAPRVFMLGPLVHTVLTRADNDNEGLKEALQEADLFAQAAEIRALGVWRKLGMHDSELALMTGRNGALLNRTRAALDTLWDVVTELSKRLMRQDIVRAEHFSRAMNGAKDRGRRGD